MALHRQFSFEVGDEQIPLSVPSHTHTHSRQSQPPASPSLSPSPSPPPIDYRQSRTSQTTSPTSPISYHDASSHSSVYPRAPDRIDTQASGESNYSIIRSDDDDYPSNRPPPPVHGDSLYRRSVAENAAYMEATRASQDLNRRVEIETLRVVDATPDAQQQRQGTRYGDRSSLDTTSDTAYTPHTDHSMADLGPRASYSSTMALGGAAASPGMNTPVIEQAQQGISLGNYPSNRGYYSDSPYRRHSSMMDLPIRDGIVDPNAILDDGDDGFIPTPRRKSILRSAIMGGSSDNVGRSSNSGSSFGGSATADAAGAAAVTAGAAAGGAAVGGVFGRLFGGGQAANSGASYGPVAGGSNGNVRHDAVAEEAVGGMNPVEKSEWLRRQHRGNKRWKWIVSGVIGTVIVAAIIGGVVGAMLSSKKSSSNSSSSSSSSSTSNKRLTRTSSEIRTLLDNPHLHKVFPGVDYTPYNAQYPDCLTNPPSQQNVTKDVAVLSQLTPAVRLYGTDCNQTQMVIEAINALELKSDLKIWLGVWLDANETTSARQLRAMYDILEEYDTSLFAGVVVGNEVLYREDMTEKQLASTLSNVKTNLTRKGINLKIATSDLGDDWTSGLVEYVDVVMSNVHPFFAGVTAEQAASWTWTFWDTHDVVLTAQNSSKGNVISEVGWPSAGGNDCGSSTCTTKTQGSVAGIDEMNTFMDNWICDALTNGTQYFWFEAFDEPWKVRYNTKTEKWEDKWGLMHVNRTLKTGVKVPSCNGKTATIDS